MRDLGDELLQAKVKTRLFGGDHAPRLGRLVLLEQVGAGAGGAVFTAYDPQLDRAVAVKVLHAAGSDANARSLGEARTLARVSHPNVVAIHDAGESDGAVYLVLELAAGVPLRAWLGPDRGWRAVVRVMRDVAAGLAAVHRAGVVHRDVKPDNILVDGDRARLVDFGLAGDAAALGEGTAPGTPRYMAPEVLAGAPATAAADQFGFAVTLFEALHGVRPHDGASRDELRAAAQRAAAATATAPRPMPAWLTAVLRRALAADPGERFPAMDEVAAQLGRDRVRRRRAIAVAGIALGLGGALGALAMRGGAGAAATCSGAARRAAVWDAAATARVRAGLGDAPWTAAALAGLDRAADRWQASFEHVCAATRHRGEQSDRLLELRMRCLDRALDKFAALAEAIGEPLDATARAEAAAAIGELPAPEACEAVVDAGELALPADPAARAEAVAIDRELDRAWAELALGRYPAARARAGELTTRVATLDAPPQRAGVALLAATVEARIGDPAEARALLDRALHAAATARAGELELAGWTRRLRLELFAGTPAHAIDWAGFARAAAARTGRDGAEIDGIVAEALRKAGRLDAALDHVRRALASRDPLTADQRAILEMNLGSILLASGRAEEAAAAFERALELARGQLGDDHPTLGVYLDKLAHARVARGRIGEALALHDRSLALRRGAFGDDDRAVATARLYRAETLLEADQLDAARAELVAARATRVRRFGDTSPRLGEIDAALGDVAAAAGDAAGARVLYAQAAALDPRLDVEARAGTSAAGAGDTGDLAAPATGEVVAIERIAALAARIAAAPPDRRGPAAAALAAWLRAARAGDAAIALPVADALVAAGDRATAHAVYVAALAALADEPSRTRERARRGVAVTAGR